MRRNIPQGRPETQVWTLQPHVGGVLAQTAFQRAISIDTHKEIKSRLGYSSSHILPNVEISAPLLILHRQYFHQDQLFHLHKRSCLQGSASSVA